MDIAFEGVRVEREGRRILDIPSLRVRGHRTTAVLGANGSGKTTLLRLIAGLERPRAGRLQFGAAAAGSTRVPTDAPAPPVAYVFQEEVFLRRSVRANLELGLRLRGIGQADRRVRMEEAAVLLGIGDLFDRRADRLSGGEGRRVGLARALCLRAPVVLLDEPLAGLDERTYSHLLDELPQLLAAFDATTLFVTHDRNEALRLAQDLVVLVDGRVHAAGDKRDVATNPCDVDVAKALGHSLLVMNGRLVAVPPGALKLGPGGLECCMVVEELVDVVDHVQVVGDVDGVRVSVVLPHGVEPPARGHRVVVRAERFSELSTPG